MFDCKPDAERMSHIDATNARSADPHAIGRGTASHVYETRPHRLGDKRIEHTFELREIERAVEVSCQQSLAQSLQVELCDGRMRGTGQRHVDLLHTQTVAAGYERHNTL